MAISTKRPARPGNPTCSAIVSAYNEEGTIASVMDGLLRTSGLDEIIVVDDGSSDGTPEILRRYGAGGRVRPVFVSPNRGKGNAMAEGASLAMGDLLLFVDADLVNWGPEYAELVLAPLLAGRADMAIGYPFRRELFWDRFDPFYFQRWISGERALWREDLLPILSSMRASRFGVETLINMRFKACHRKEEFVALKDLIHPIKFEKTPGRTAWREYTREGLQIARTHLRHPIYTLMTTIPDYYDLRDACRAIARAIGKLNAPSPGI